MVLTDKFNDYHMGITAENLVEQYQISRKEQDQFAFDSQQKHHVHNKLVVCCGVKALFPQDEDGTQTTIDKLAQLRPAFKKMDQ